MPILSIAYHPHVLNTSLEKVTPTPAENDLSVEGTAALEELKKLSAKIHSSSHYASPSRPISQAQSIECFSISFLDKIEEAQIIGASTALQEFSKIKYLDICFSDLTDSATANETLNAVLVNTKMKTFISKLEIYSTNLGIENFALLCQNFNLHISLCDCRSMDSLLPSHKSLEEVD